VQNNVDITTIRALHQAGELDQAKTGYLAILRDNPRSSEALHWLGILHIQQDNFSDAVECLKEAIKYDSKNLVIYLHLANALKFLGLFDQAVRVLQNTIANNPDYVAAFNNLGTVYYAKGNLDDAIHYYQKAITKQPNYIDAYYNLGLALFKKNLFSDAIDIYQKLLRQAPEHFAARFHLACTFMQQNKIEDAIAEFITIEIAQPYHFETQSNLATCYLKQGNFNQAKTHYQNALALRSQDTQILFNLGYIHMQQGFLDAAIQYYQRALVIDPNLFAAHNNLGVAFLAKQQTELAIQYFQKALHLQPNNEAVAYTVKALEQNKYLETAPPDYIQSLFDSYADHYESHLLNTLDYKLPELFENALAPFISTHIKWDILDLGCGTGLCGIPFKDYANTLTGVDLSANMLKMAAQKNVYDALIKNDITTFLKKCTEQYDLILAGDMLVYSGELDGIFQLVSQSLRSEGLFVFNAEIGDASTFKMNSSGRFSHHKIYLDKLAEKQHFSILSYQKIISRIQNNEPVYGHLYILKHVTFEPK
jgi:predicted TPR repeat methyltransferase